MMPLRESDWTVAFDGVTIAVVGRVKDSTELWKLIQALQVYAEPLDHANAVVCKHCGASKYERLSICDEVCDQCERNGPPTIPVKSECHWPKSGSWMD